MAPDGSKSDVKAIVVGYAAELGFDLVRVASAEDFTEDRTVALARLRAGLMSGLPWYTEARVRRGTSPQELLPGARSIICLGVNYYQPAGPAPPPGNATGKVAMYARGRDYHKPMKGRMRAYVEGLRALLDSTFEARWYVDDGPMLDRAASRRAGLGWTGKNTNLLTPGLGSWVFLGQVVTNLALDADLPLRKSCGACVRCIDACPTGAIVAQYTVDNARCISYLTIENWGPVPAELRPQMQDWVFGCDICQEICPVNRKALSSGSGSWGKEPAPSMPGALPQECPSKERSDEESGAGSLHGSLDPPPQTSRFTRGNIFQGIFEARPTQGGQGEVSTRHGLEFLDLVGLLEMSEEEFRHRFRGTPVLRAKRAGLQRNACVALGNRRDPATVAALRQALLNGETLVRGHAAWALGRIGTAEAQQAIDQARVEETDQQVLEEIADALEAQNHPPGVKPA
jgi:epoxyqueuosine reductase